MGLDITTQSVRELLYDYAICEADRLIEDVAKKVYDAHDAEEVNADYILSLVRNENNYDRDLITEEEIKSVTRYIEKNKSVIYHLAHSTVVKNKEVADKYLSEINTGDYMKLLDREDLRDVTFGSWALIHYLRSFVSKLHVLIDKSYLLDMVKDEEKVSKAEILEVLNAMIIAGTSNHLDLSSQEGVESFPAICNHPDNRGHYIPSIGDQFDVIEDKFTYGSSLKLFDELKLLDDLGVIEELETIITNTHLHEDEKMDNPKIINARIAKNVIYCWEKLMHFTVDSIVSNSLITFT